MQAIITKYLGPSNVRGSRIKATCDGGSVTIPLDYALDTESNHRQAAEALCAKMKWSGKLIGGGIPNGYAWVFERESFYSINLKSV